MTAVQIQARLDAVWKDEGIKVDWLALESLQRDIFAALGRKTIEQQEALCFIAESLEAFTRRGPVASF